LGYLDQAHQQAQKALALAQESRLPYSVVIALDAATVVSLNRGDLHAAHEGAEAMIALAHEQEFAYWLARGTLWKGYVLVAQGRKDEGFAQIRQGYTALLTVGSEIHRTFQSVPLARSCGAVGQIQEGLQLLAEALAFVEKTGARCSEAGMHLVKGELLLQKRQALAAEFPVANPQSRTLNPQVEAEACFHKAIAIAQQQGAKAWELLAVMSLSRLWQKQGRTAEARQLLAGIYHWFTEGFDTADLQEAKVLLKQLTDACA
jgi:predicted ATPase